MRSPLSLLKAEQTNYVQPLCRSYALQTFHHLCCHPLDTFQYFYILFAFRKLKLHTVLEVRMHQCWVQLDNPLHLSTVSYTVPDDSQDTAGSFVLQGILLTHIELVIKQTLQIPFCRSALQALVPQSIRSFRITFSGAKSSIWYVNFIWLVIAQCSGLSWCLCKTSLPFTESAASPILVLLANLFCVHTTPVSRLLTKTLKRTGPEIEP